MRSFYSLFLQDQMCARCGRRQECEGDVIEWLDSQHSEEPDESMRGAVLSEYDAFELDLALFLPPPDLKKADYVVAG